MALVLMLFLRKFVLMPLPKRVKSPPNNSPKLSTPSKILGMAVRQADHYTCDSDPIRIVELNFSTST